MFGRILALALPLLLTGAALGQPVRSVEPDRIETIRLDENGQAILRFETPRPGIASFDVFAAAPELGALTLTQSSEEAIDSKLAEAGATVAMDPVSLPAGRHRLLLQAQGESGGRGHQIQGRLRIDPPGDPFEPNDTPETATRIELPVREILDLTSGDTDWFRVDPPGPGYLGVQLFASSSYAGPQIEVRREDGEILLQTVLDNASWLGMRYLETDGRPLLVGVRETYAGSMGPSFPIKRLDIVHYRADIALQGGFITLPGGPDTAVTDQLALIADALGAEAVSADQATIVTAELNRATQGRTEGRASLWMGLLLAALVFAAGAVLGFGARRALSD